MKRVAVIILLAAVLVPAMAVPAFAGTSGTVYGKAVLAPYAIVITGGTDPGSPLTYEGRLGASSPEKFGSLVTVQNSGTQDALVKVDVNELPTDGVNQWNLGSSYPSGGLDTAYWSFGQVNSDGNYILVLPSSDPNYNQYSEFPFTVAPGGSIVMNSFFGFPSSTSSMGDHTMSATFSVVAPG